MRKARSLIRSLLGKSAKAQGKPSDHRPKNDALSVTTSSPKPIELMTDDEVRRELLQHERDGGEAEFVSAGAGDRQLLNLKRGMDRSRRIESGELKTATAGDEALFSAVKNLSKTEVSKALKSGANVNAKNNSGATPLHQAMPGWNSAGFKEEEVLMPIVKLLVEAGADVNAHNPSERDWTPLITAALEVDERRYLGIIAYLIEQGADLQARDSGGRTALDLVHAENNWRYRYLIEILESAQNN